jgi:hypothetical protein
VPALYGRRTKNLRSFFIRVVPASWCWPGAPCCFTRLGRIALMGTHGHSDLGRTDEEQEHLAAATIEVVSGKSAYSSQASGVRSGSGARVCVMEHRRFSHRSTARGPAIAGGPAGRLGNGRRSGVVTASSVLRRFGGCSKRRRHRARFDLAGAHSRGRITSRWSRRARQSGAILSLRRAAQREPLDR